MSGSSDEMNCGRTKPSEDVKDLSLKLLHKHKRKASKELGPTNSSV